MLGAGSRSEEHTSELQSHHDLVCRLLLENKKGRRDWRVPRRLLLHLDDSFEMTRKNQTMNLTLAFNYGGRAEIIDAVKAFLFNDTATTEIYTLSLHDALPIRSSAACSWPTTQRAGMTQIVRPSRE